MVALENNRGFSLVEAMVVIAIVAIMGTFAVPPMISWLQNKGLNNAARDLYSNMRKAQSMAVKNNRNCAISFDGNNGYKVFVDEDKDYTYHATAEPAATPPKKADNIIAQVLWTQYRNVKVSNNEITFAVNNGTKSFAFRPNLIPTNAGTVELMNSNLQHLYVVVSSSGNISLRNTKP